MESLFQSGIEVESPPVANPGHFITKGKVRNGVDGIGVDYVEHA